MPSIFSIQKNKYLKKLSPSSANINKIVKEHNFNHRFNISTPPTYDALQDPHTSYYFSNKSIKQHLKILKKTVKEEKNRSERIRKEKLITFQINNNYDQFTSKKKSIDYRPTLSSQIFGLRKISCYSLDSNRINRKSLLKHVKIGKDCIKNKQLITPHYKEISPSSNESQDNNIECQKTAKDKDKTISKNLSKNRPKISQQAQLANKLAQSLHTLKHKKWLSFLQENKQKLSANLSHIVQ